jgi:preprotein translocase subunit YajC
VFISTAIAQTTAPAAGPESSLLNFLPLVAMFVVLYFIMIRPQMKRQKEHKAMIEALAKGDEVVTAGGLLGKVTKLGDSTLQVEARAGRRSAAAAQRRGASAAQGQRQVSPSARHWPPPNRVAARNEHEPLPALEIPGAGRGAADRSDLHAAQFLR